jgi:FlaA1/EpsC-like NDP-sugar epimerase
MSGKLLRVSQVAIDLTVLTVAFLAAFLIRFDGAPPPAMISRLVVAGPYVVVFEYFALVAFGVHRFSWRYVGLREATRILLAATLSSAALMLARQIVGQIDHPSPHMQLAIVPFGVLAINFIISYLGIVGVRVVRRVTGERAESERRRFKDRPAVPTLLVGAGQAGVLVAREIAGRPDLGLRPVGFLDDDPRKVGSVIQGIPVLGDTSRLPEICAQRRAKQALITMANVPGSTIQRIRRLCDEAGVAVKIIPGVYEIVGGTVNLSRIRDINIEDLLRRDPVDLDVETIAADIAGKVVLTTGAGGSIGSELCRQICRFSPSAVILVERAENALFNIHRELTHAHPELQIVPCIADITDVARMDELFAIHKPSLVLHAAAHKHVPMMEWNPVEAVKNNVLGTKTVADLALQHQVQAFVMISTDKAVKPTSVMGASKRAAEAYIQALSQGATTRFVTVRFGNVLGSAGSVIPIFQEQIAAGGPITVTHPEMRRYFMTIPEACQLVLQAGTMGEGGEIFILDMGEPVKIVDLARELVALSGLVEGEDIEIVFSGVRPGEKLFEELSTDEERAEKTRHPKIFVGRIERQPWEHVSKQLGALSDAVRHRDADRTRSALRDAVPGYVGPLPVGQGEELQLRPSGTVVGDRDAAVEPADGTAVLRGVLAH